MKHLQLTAILFFMTHLAISTSINFRNYESIIDTAGKVSVDWQHPTNQSHPHALEFKGFSKRKLARLYHMNIQADKQFNQHGFVQTQGKVSNIVSNRAFIVFHIKKGNIYNEEKVLIYAKPPQKLILKNQ